MGLFDMIKNLHPESRLFGFLNGPHGIFTNNYMEITLDYMNLFRNTGGFDMIRKCKSLKRAQTPLPHFLSNAERRHKLHVEEINHNACCPYAQFIAMVENISDLMSVGSGRHKIETEQQFADSLKYCTQLNLDGIVVIGGDDSNTNACLLAEYFAKNNSKTKVIGCPKTIDGDL